jgi:hypothetical protein
MQITNSPLVLNFVHSLPVPKDVTVVVTDCRVILSRRFGEGVLGAVVAEISSAPIASNAGIGHRYDVEVVKNWFRGPNWLSSRKEGSYNERDFLEAWKCALRYVSAESNEEWAARQNREYAEETAAKRRLMKAETALLCEENRDYLHLAELQRAQIEVADAQRAVAEEEARV